MNRNCYLSLIILPVLMAGAFIAARPVPGFDNLQKWTMKNIITVLDANHSSQGAIDLSCYLTGLIHAKLTGIFPAYPNDTHAPFARFVNETAPSVVQNKHKAALVEEAISHFQEVCLQRDVRCHIRRDNDDPGTDIVRETLFADVMIVDEAVSFSDDDNKVPSRFITALLAHAKCPVIVAAASFDVIEEIIFAYDGTYSSVFALRQFTYLFPELKDRKFRVVEVTNTGTIDEVGRLNAWLRDNYSWIEYETLTGNAADRLFEIMMSRQKVLLVTGAYGRSTFSSFFRSGPADRIIKLGTNPVFIAHH